MATAVPPTGHRRNKSASVLKSLIIPKNHKRAPSDDTPLSKAAPVASPFLPGINLQTPLLPPDHPHSQLRTANQTENIPPQVSSPRKIQDAKSSPKKGLHKKTLSSVSLRALAGKDEKSKPKKSLDVRRPQEGEKAVHASKTPKKPKSSSNLAAMFGKAKPKDTKQSPVKEIRDKENTSPPSLSNEHVAPRTPIWAEFSSQPVHEIMTTSKVPLNDQRRSIEEEIALYTPQEYSPSKQRNFFDYQVPSLQKRPVVKDRPQSMALPRTTSTSSFIETFTRKLSNERVPLGDTKGNECRTKESSPLKAPASRPNPARASTDTTNRLDMLKQSSQPAIAVKKPNRVMAAVAAFNGKSKHPDAPSASSTKLDPKVVDAEFEEVLESRNIPTHQRAQMRTLKLEVKADFVRMHKLDTPQASRTTSAHSSINEPAKRLSKASMSQDGMADQADIEHSTEKGNTTKRERPRSKTFTFNRSDSPTKKQKGDNDRKAWSKPAPIPKSPSTRSLVSNASDRSVSGGAKTVKPDEFIIYLKKTTSPQEVEVGKLHKLRLLLRNETVDWVDAFIQNGGMTELVGLLHRVMEMEWREDHEDTLLHELLRCLKGLCTADTALKQLVEISTTLYPALLAMLFDEEHKGPSEFTTREYIIEILFAHISTAPEAELEARAMQLLNYLRDPVKEKETSTIPFILQMHQSRPYQVWCKEITNVTKEVFWIFIHHLNVVPVPHAPSTELAALPYSKRHFPGQRAIVPAAPYVGGVEWDATNYLATHLDLLNGLLASLPTHDARNALRHDFKISGFEKLMSHLRTCNPKYYGAVHDSIKVWIGAALEDDWDVKLVRMGPGDGKGNVSPLKQSPKKKAEKAPQLGEPPKMDVGLGLGLGLGFEREVKVGEGRRDDDWI